LHTTIEEPRNTALVVDDSKTARIILSRMLEGHGLEVETAQSAEQALEHLRHHRPKVIFMDHMMPGMDGLQAVQEIKKDPRTAMIPVLMYTAKQGEVYMGEARALGAVGILSKQVRPAEVFEVLLGLGLVNDRRERSPEPDDEKRSRSRLFAENEDPGDEVPELPGPMVAPQPAVDLSVLRSQIAELMDDYLHRHRQEMAGIREAVDKSCRKAVEMAVERTRDRFTMQVPPPELSSPVITSPGRQPGAMRWPMVMMLVLAGVAAWLFVRSADLDRNLAEAATREDLLRDTVSWAMNLDGGFEFGEPALGDSALERVHELVTRLRWSGFEGTVRLEGHVGRFCLDGDSSTGFAPALPELPASQCAQVGQDLEIALAMGEAMSDGFSDYLNRFEIGRPGNIRLEVVSLGDDAPKQPYPSSTSGISAGDWNQIARHNNRVEVRLLPD
jgi:CheY-like chemotaxis protein